MKVAPLIKKLLYSKSKENKSTDLGLEKEAVTIRDYKEHKTAL